MIDKIERVSIVMANGLAYDIPGSYVTSWSLTERTDTASWSLELEDGMGSENIEPLVTWVEIDLSLVAPYATIYSTSLPEKNQYRLKEVNRYDHTAPMLSDGEWQ